MSYTYILLYPAYKDKLSYVITQTKQYLQKQKPTILPQFKEIILKLKNIALNLYVTTASDFHISNNKFDETFETDIEL